MLVTNLPDGSVLYEGRADHFSQEWNVAPTKDKVVLPDGRPAVRWQKESGQTAYTTILPYLWSILKTLPRDRQMVKNRVKLCEACGAELKMVKETEQCWSFACDKCKSVEVHGKDFLGGTIGQGLKEPR